MLFKIHIEVILKEWVQHCGGMGIKICDKIGIHLLFADDQIIMIQNKKDPKYVTEQASKAYYQ